MTADDSHVSHVSHAYDTGTPELLAERTGGVATVTFDNPAKLNAITRAMQIALPRVVDRIRVDPTVRVLVLTGAGDRAFVSGADISEFGEHRTEVADRADYDRARADTERAWAEFDKPVIAKIRGFCLGAGLLTALAADIRIASDDSQFGVPAAKLGLGFAFPGVEALASVVGGSWAAEIMFSARRLTAADAMRIGLINRAAPVEELDETVAELASQIAANAPLTVSAMKAGLQELRRPHGERDHARVADLVEACFRSEDYREGQAAFAERRPARFVGH